MGTCSSKPKTNEYDGSMAPESKLDDNGKENMKTGSNTSVYGRKSTDNGKPSMDKNNLAAKGCDLSVQTWFAKPEQGEEAFLGTNTLKDIFLDLGKAQKQQDNVDNEKLFNAPVSNFKEFEKQRPENGAALAEARASYHKCSEPLTIVDEEAGPTTSSETVKYQLRELQTDSFESELVKASGIYYSKTVSLDREPQASDGTENVKLQMPSISSPNIPAEFVLVNRQPAVQEVSDYREVDEIKADELRRLQTELSCTAAGQGNRALKPMPEEPEPVMEESGSDSGRDRLNTAKRVSQEQEVGFNGFSSLSKDVLYSDVSNKRQETEAHDDCGRVEKIMDTSLQLAAQKESDTYHSGREIDVKLEESQGAAIDSPAEWRRYVRSTVFGEDILQSIAESEPSNTVKDFIYGVFAADEARPKIYQDTPNVTTRITVVEEPITQLETEIAMVHVDCSKNCDGEPVGESEKSLTGPVISETPGILNRATAAGESLLDSNLETGILYRAAAAGEELLDSNLEKDSGFLPAHTNADLKKKKSVRSFEARDNEEIPLVAAESVISSTPWTGKEGERGLITKEKSLPLISPVSEPKEPGLTSQNGVIADSDQSTDSAMPPEVLTEGKPKVRAIKVDQNETVKPSIPYGEADAASNFAKQTIGIEIEESQSHLNSIGRLPKVLTDAMEQRVDQVVGGEGSLDGVHRSNEEVFEPKTSSAKEMELISLESMMQKASDIKNHRSKRPEVLESPQPSKLEGDFGAQVAEYNDSLMEICSSTETEKFMEIEKLLLVESCSFVPDIEGKLLLERICGKQDIDPAIPDIEQVLENLASEFERQASAEMGNNPVPS